MQLYNTIWLQVEGPSKSAAWVHGHRLADGHRVAIGAADLGMLSYGMCVYTCVYIHVYIYIYIYIYICHRPLYLKDTKITVSVQVRLKTRPWPAGRFSLSGGGRARACSAPAQESLAVHTYT